MNKELAALDAASVESFESQVAGLILQYGEESENITLYQAVLGSYKYKTLLKLHNGKTTGWKHYCEVNKLRDRAKNGAERLAHHLPARHYLEDLLVKHKRNLPDFLLEATEFIKAEYYLDGNMQGMRLGKKNTFLPKLPFNPSSEERAIEKLEAEEIAKAQATATSELDDGIASAEERQKMAEHEVTLNESNSIYSLSKILMSHTQGGTLAKEVWQFLSNICGLSTDMVDNPDLDYLEISKLRTFMKNFHKEMQPKIITEDLTIVPLEGMSVDNHTHKGETISQPSIIEWIVSNQKHTKKEATKVA